jgi:hypothetical protein
VHNKGARIHGHCIVKLLFFVYNLCVEYPVKILCILMFSNLTGDPLTRLIEGILYSFIYNLLPNNHSLERFCSGAH